MKRSHHEFSLGEAVNAFMDEANLTETSLVRRVILHWQDVVGSAVADNTAAVWYRGGVFYVEMKNSVWKNELLYRRSEVVEKINQYAQHPLATEVRVQ